MAKRTSYTKLNVKRTSYSRNLFEQDLLSDNQPEIDIDKYRDRIEDETKSQKKTKRNRLAKSSLFALLFFLFSLSLVSNNQFNAPLIDNVFANTGISSIAQTKTLSEHEARIANRVRSLFSIPTVVYEQTIPQPIVPSNTIPQPLPTDTVENLPTPTWTPDPSIPTLQPTNTYVALPENTATIIVPENTATNIVPENTVIVLLPENTATIALPTATNIIATPTMVIGPTNTIEIPTVTPVPLLTVTPANTIVYINPTPIGTFVGTDGTLNGKEGLVPAPLSNDVNKFLRSDGIWVSLEEYFKATMVPLPTVTALVTSTPLPIELLSTATPYIPVATATEKPYLPTPTPLPIELLVTATPYIPVPTATEKPYLPTVTPLPAELLVTTTPESIVIGNSIEQNGVLINWGIITVSGNGGTATVTFSKGYPNTNYSISFAIDGTWNVGGNIEAPIWYQSVTSSSFVIKTDSQLNGNIEVRWQTIGKTQ